jgi:hypothetical protein
VGTSIDKGTGKATWSLKVAPKVGAILGTKPSPVRYDIIARKIVLK